MQVAQYHAVNEIDAKHDGHVRLKAWDFAAEQRLTPGRGGSETSTDGGSK